MRSHPVKRLSPFISPVRGFSLLEVLVALAIFAMVSVTAYRQVSVSSRAALHIEEKQLALWLAGNTLEQYFIRRDWPLAGEDVREQEMAGHRWIVKTTAEAAEQKGLIVLRTSVYRDEKSEDAIISLFRLAAEKN